VKRSTGLTATGLALGPALLLTGAAGTAHARTTTVQPGSNLCRWGGNVNVGADPAPGIPHC
jgi:hypothetical protein